MPNSGLLKRRQQLGQLHNNKASHSTNLTNWETIGDEFLLLSQYSFSRFVVSYRSQLEGGIFYCINVYKNSVFIQAYSNKYIFGFFQLKILLLIRKTFQTYERETLQKYTILKMNLVGSFCKLLYSKKTFKDVVSSNHSFNVVHFKNIFCFYSYSVFYPARVFIKLSFTAEKC